MIKHSTSQRKPHLEPVPLKIRLALPLPGLFVVALVAGGGGGPGELRATAPLVRTLAGGRGVVRHCCWLVRPGGLASDLVFCGNVGFWLRRNEEINCTGTGPQSHSVGRVNGSIVGPFHSTPGNC